MNQLEMKQLAYQSNLKNRALQVLLYLIDRTNKEQTCFPAVPTIGRELHISISTVKRAMRELVEAGYVKKESRFRENNGGQTSNLYTLYFIQDERTVDSKGAEQEDAETEMKSEMEATGIKQECVCQKCAENTVNYKEQLEAKWGVEERSEQGNDFIYNCIWTGEEVSLIPP